MLDCVWQNAFWVSFSSQRLHIPDDGSFNDAFKKCSSFERSGRQLIFLPLRNLHQSLVFILKKRKQRLVTKMKTGNHRTFLWNENSPLEKKRKKEKALMISQQKQTCCIHRETGPLFLGMSCPWNNNFFIYLFDFRKPQLLNHTAFVHCFTVHNLNLNCHN